MNKFAFISVALILIGLATSQNCAGIANWNVDADYTAGQFVQINGLLYQAQKNNRCRNPCYPDTEWDRNPWVLVDTCNVNCASAQNYDNTKQYQESEIVKFNQELYISLWGGNYGNRPDLNSGDWGAWKRLFKCACVTVQHDCASFTYSTGNLDANGRVCVRSGTTITFTAFAQTDALARVIGSSTQTIVAIQDTTITFDCEYAVYVTIQGNCVVTPNNGVYTYWPSDKSDLTVLITAPTRPDRQCRINSITLDGSKVASVTLTDISTSHTIIHVCECQVCVDISGDCVNNPSSRTCEYASDGVRLEISVEAPVKEGYECTVDSILVDGVSVQSVVFDPLNADHTVVTDCSCRLICPYFYGCENTDNYNSAQSKVYNQCECAKQTFDCPNGEGTQIVFCAPLGAQIRCDQNIYDGHLIWQFQAICKGTVVNYVAGQHYVGGSIVRKNEICYVAKWYSTEDPATNFGLYQAYRYLGKC